MLELTIGPIWAVPMDIAPRYAGTASGLMNAGSAVAGIISPIIFGFVIDATGNWTLPFLGSIGLLALGALATFWIRPGRQVTGPVRKRASPPPPDTLSGRSLMPTLVIPGPSGARSPEPMNTGRSGKVPSRPTPFWTAFVHGFRPAAARRPE